MPNSTIIKEKLICPHQHIHQKLIPKVILSSSISLYPRRYKAFNDITMKNSPLQTYPVNFYISGCNHCFTKIFKALIKERIEFLKDKLSDTVEDCKISEVSLHGKDKSGHFSEIEFICRNSESEKYHKDYINETGSIIVIAETVARIANISRYYMLENKPVAINMDCCSNCFGDILVSEIDTYINKALIEKIIDHPDFNKDDPERTKAFIMRLFNTIKGNQ